MTVDLTIKNCKLWYKKKTLVFGVAIDDGKIVSISKDIRLPKSDENINCRGKIVLPGLIDAHVHFREPGFTWKEDWSTGSKAAAHGGITHVMDMPNTDPSTITVRNLLDKKELAKKSVVNFGLYAEVVKENIDSIKELANHSVAFKVYMSESTGGLKLDDNTLLMKAFYNISKTNKVVCVHAENQAINERCLKRYRKSSDPLEFSLSRPVESEILAIKDAIETARRTEAKLHVCHVTTKEGLNLIKKAKKDVDITCETCPQYLFMTQNDLRDKGTLAKTNPPLRTKEDQIALWKRISNGTIDIIASDHAPHTMQEKLQDMWIAPAGVPGVETTLQLMLNAVNKRMIKLERLVGLMHDNPVKRFGLTNYGIEVGKDANLTVIDLKKEWKISNDDLLTKCKWSPYDGWKGKGCPEITIVNGQRLNL
ncbi:MAG: dihydroorotase family protein [Candidatus Aenigmarchaeota archaeon]|nr:dihydroorotase family protein [Candidatus Aenigmarchaeota archaeon]